MSTEGLTRHEQDRPPIMTEQERLRFAFALIGSDWADHALPASWRYLQDGFNGPCKWTDAIGKREIRKAEILEALAISVEDEFGFTPSQDELGFIYTEVVCPMRNRDAIHRFFHLVYSPSISGELDLTELWDRWRQWKPLERPRISQAAFLEALQARGYRVVLSGDEGEGVLKGWRKRTTPLTTAGPKRRGRKQEQVS